jgi:MoaA/NifB/PqqE/SkfB family radical SAM enzyme
MLEKAPPEVRRTVRASGFHPRFSPPRFLFLQVNKRCNLRCVHCAFWRDNDDDKPNISIARGNGGSCASSPR